MTPAILTCWPTTPSSKQSGVFMHGQPTRISNFTRMLLLTAAFGGRGHSLVTPLLPSIKMWNPSKASNPGQTEVSWLRRPGCP